MLDLDNSGNLNNDDVPKILDVKYSNFKTSKSNSISTAEWNAACGQIFYDICNFSYKLKQMNPKVEITLF